MVEGPTLVLLKGRISVVGVLFKVELPLQLKT